MGLVDPLNLFFCFLQAITISRNYTTMVQEMYPVLPGVGMDMTFE